jgi:hypothetical protein
LLPFEEVIQSVIPEQRLKAFLDNLVHSEKKAECWSWKGNTVSGGYGRFFINGRKHLIHRLVFKAYNGGLSDTELVRHSCNNPNCCNPMHLKSGTNEDNAKDAQISGAYQQMSRKTATVPDSIVIEMREMYLAGHKSSVIAKKYGLTQARTHHLLFDRRPWLQKISIREKSKSKKSLGAV